MLTIRPRDYFSLEYDAAAQNKIDTLKGKTYTRNAVVKQVSQSVTNVHLDGAGEVTLPYGPRLSHDYSDTKGGPGYLKQLEACLWHSQGISTRSGAPSAPSYNPSANQCVLLGTFEVLFTGLNLPDGVVPTFDVRYEAQHEAYWKEYVSSSVPSKALELSGDGALITDDWENLWIGAGLRPTTERAQSVDNEDTRLQELRSAYALSLEGVGIADGTKEEQMVSYAILGSYPPEVSDRWNFMFMKGLEWSSFQDVVKLDIMSGTQDLPESNKARYLKGNNFSLATYQMELLDRDTCRVTGTVPIYNAHAGEGNWSSVNREEHFSITDWVRALIVTLSFTQPDWSGFDFEHAADGSEDLYPYVFHNTRIANAGDTVMGNSWDNYYPKLLLDKFAEGKYYATIKVRVGFALANDIRVDTLVQIYDLNNQVISRAGVPCTFRVKRVVRSFGNNEFYYIINCLEE